jgi:hypothetical protein
MKSVRKRLTYANVMSSIAVFLVLAGGTAFAANQLGKNTVGSKQLKNNAVTAAKIKNGAVTGSKLAKGAVGASAINTTGLTVPNASHAGTADSATNATNASHAGTADNATNATNASHASTADSATNAGNAATVGGMTISKISYTAATDSAPQTILNTQGLVFTASCPGGNPKIVANAVGVPAGVGVEFNSSVTSSGNAVENFSDDGTAGIFTTGDEFAKVRGRGTFIFQRSDGHVVTGDFDVDDTPAIHDVNGGSIADCAIGGSVIAG